MRALILSSLLAFGIVRVAIAGTEENAEDFMAMHEIEIVFHDAGTTKNLIQMLSLFGNNATIEAGGKTYSGKEQIRAYWRAGATFQPKNQWVVYTPAFRIKYDVRGDTAHLYFECLTVDKITHKIVAHTNSDDTLTRVNGRWLIKDMKAGVVPEL